MTDVNSAMSRRSLLVGGLCLATAAGATGLDLRKKTQKPVDERLSDELPSQIGKWVVADEGGVIRPAEDARASIYDQEVSRVFQAPDEPGLMLLIAYGSTQSDTLQVHRPEFCYPAAGFKIENPQIVRQPVAPGLSVPATLFTATRGERVEQVLYWVRLGRYFPDSWAKQHLVRIRNAFDGVIPDGILVRASVIDPDRERAKALLGDFLVQLTHISPLAARRALIGRS